MKMILIDGQTYIRHWGRFYVVIYDTATRIQLGERVEDEEEK